MTEPIPTEVRPVRADDEHDVRAFLARLSPRTLHARYLSPFSTLVGPPGEREARRLLDGNRRRHVVVVADSAAHIRAIGEFFVDDSGERAELALVVEDHLQGRGLGQLLYSRLELRARELGIAHFTGTIGAGNLVVISLLRRSGRTLRVDLDRGTIRFTLALNA